MRFAEALRVSDDADGNRVAALYNLGRIHTFSDELDVALELLERGLAEAERIGSPHFTAQMRSMLAHALVRAGEVDRGMAEHARSEAEARIGVGPALAFDASRIGPSAWSSWGVWIGRGTSSRSSG